MDKYIPGIGLSAGSWMIKWDIMTRELQMSDLQLVEGDEINVFINFESVLRNLALQKNLQSQLTYFKHNVVIELESAIINLIANYKAYFSMRKCKPKLYFYYTDLESHIQQMQVYNKYYRSYYRNRYLNNPQFRMMGDTLRTIIIPEVKLILSYIPNCYFVSAKGFEGSLIPKIISSNDNRKNVIISGDVFDTLYMFDPNFIVFYIKRRFNNLTVCTTIESTVKSIIRGEDPFDLSIFNSELYFKILLSIKGSKIRNIKAAKGYGYNKFMEAIQNGLRSGAILEGFSSIDSIINLFPKNYAENIKSAFECTNLDTQINLLGPGNVDHVLAQVVDKIDIKSVEMLNNKRFLEFPLNLQSLIE